MCFLTENKYEKYSSILKKKETRFNKPIMALYKTAENRLWRHIRMAMEQRESINRMNGWCMQKGICICRYTISWIQQRYSE